MNKLDSLVGRKGRVITSKGFMYWNSPDEVNEVIRIDTLDIPTTEGFRQKKVLVIRDSQGVEHDLAPSAIKDVQPV